MEEKRDIFEDLERLGEEIEAAEKELNQKEGKREAILDRIQQGFKVKGIEEAKQSLNKMISRRDELQEQLEAVYQRLRTEYEW